MLFSSSIFLFIFLPFILIFYYNPWIKTRTYKNVILLIGSLFFYAWGEPLFVFIMLFSILINWIGGLSISRVLCVNKIRKAKVILVILISYNLGLLFVFKYLSFFLRNIGLLINENFGVDIALPIGISFFTFQILSYVIDIYTGKVKAQKSIYKLALYITMFPQLIAGPIVRYSLISQEIDNRQENIEEFGRGLVRFIYGLSKKVILANYMGILADNMFYLAKENTLSVCAAWLGAIAYTLQIYYDFSGYSDMAIGLGYVFGFHFNENFNYPYIARTITEFWRRWHISLSEWFRDYVYIPLGGNRSGSVKTVLNLLIVWGLTGLWHGANWTFIAWGLGYFALLNVERLERKYIQNWKGSHILTLFCVIILWVIFRAENLQLASQYIYSMFGGSGLLCEDSTLLYFKDSWLLICISIICTLPIKHYACKCKYFNLIEKIYVILSVPLLIICISKCVTSSYNPFIYFNF